MKVLWPGKVKAEILESVLFGEDGGKEREPTHSFRIVWVLALCYGIQKEKYPVSEHSQDDLLTILYITFWDGECRQVSFLRVRWWVYHENAAMVQRAIHCSWASWVHHGVITMTQRAMLCACESWVYHENIAVVQRAKIVAGHDSMATQPTSNLSCSFIDKPHPKGTKKKNPLFKKVTYMFAWVSMYVHVSANGCKCLWRPKVSELSWAAWPVCLEQLRPLTTQQFLQSPDSSSNKPFH